MENYKDIKTTCEKEDINMNKVIKMFFIFLKIGTFTLGGGYAMIPLIQEELVNKNKWMKNEEFVDTLAICQSIPGAMAINVATYIGYSMFGFIGAIVGCIATIMPAMIIMGTISVYFIKVQDNALASNMFKGIRPAVVALILTGVIKIGKALPREKKFIIWVIIATLGIILIKIHPIWIILTSAIVGYMLFRGETDNDTKDI